MTDNELIELITQKNIGKATKSLYKYFPVVKKYVLANNGTKEDAEDVFQDALIILFTKVGEGSFVLTSSLNTFLFSICRLKWFDKLRLLKKDVIVSNELNDSEYEKYIGEDDKVKLMQLAFEKLGSRCKELLYRFYYAKESMVKIAKEMKFSSDKLAKNQKYRCLEKTRELIKNAK
jgi:RNA polymerase sigma factor (sigma-70 family)